MTPPDENIPTPMTDAKAVVLNYEAGYELGENWKEAVDADFARQLERELQQAQAVAQHHQDKYLHAVSTYEAELQQVRASVQRDVRLAIGIGDPFSTEHRGENAAETTHQ